MRLILYTLLFYSLTSVFASYASVNSTIPSRILQLQPELQPLGQARYSKFGFKLYYAELWASASSFESGADYVLTLRYQRNISQAKLIDATAKEWQRLGLDTEQQQRWLARLDKIWPSVEKGSILSCHVIANQKTSFYLGDQYIGTINDAEFGLAFLDIWLSEKSQFKKQRNALLGAM